MKWQKTIRILSLLMCALLIATIAIAFTSCKGNNAVVDDNRNNEKTTIGSGNTKFYFNVVDLNKNTTCFEIHTDKSVLSESLIELNLISGEDGPYGLFVKKVNGLELEENHYWMLYVENDMAPTGVDQTKIQPDTTYSFIAS